MDSKKFEGWPSQIFGTSKNDATLRSRIFFSDYLSTNMTGFPLKTEQLSIGLIWLFHVSGILGILYGNAEWFIASTPLNLSLSFALLYLNGRTAKNFHWMLLAGFMVGMITEILGVNFGWIFGSYNYGEMLGWKVLGVPLLIGANWALLVLCTGAISRELAQHPVSRVLMGTAMMLLLDLLIEPIAPQLDFWEFDGGTAPLQNFIGWGAVALPLQLLFHSLKIELKGYYYHNLYLLQLLFFTILLLKLNS